MIWLLTHALAAPETDAPAPAPTGPAFLLAVFPTSPPERVRRKLIRHAMKRSPALQGGRDWGRAMCFRFAGPSDPEAIQQAIVKAKAPANPELRDVPDCQQPPVEALLPPEPKRIVAIHLVEAASPATIRNAIDRLIELRDLGVSTARTLEGPAKTFCMEFTTPPDPELLAFALQALPFEVERTEDVKTCRDAFLP